MSVICRKCTRLAAAAVCIVMLAAQPIGPLAVAAHPHVSSSSTSAASGSSTYSFKQISAGGTFACGLTIGGKAICWGDDTYGQAEPPGVKFMRISAGSGFACGLTAKGRIVCWGDDQYGQTKIPIGNYSEVSAGQIGACALTLTGKAVCWGADYYGVIETPPGTFTHISAGAYGACAVTSGAKILCWGSVAKNAPSGAYEQVSMGKSGYTCGLKTDGSISCWGGETASGTSPPGGSFTQVSAGYNFACALDKGGAVACWGSDTSNDGYEDYISGQTEPPSGTFSQVSSGGAESGNGHGGFGCGIRAGKVVCWGWNTRAETLGLSGTFTSVSAGGFEHCCQSALPVCALEDAPLGPGTVICWGTPLGVKPTAGFSQISVGGNVACGIKGPAGKPGPVFCWPPMGGSATNRSGPKPALKINNPPGGVFTRVSVGYYFACGLGTNGKVRCWGSTNYWKAKLPTVALSQISVGYGSACGLKAGGSGGHAIVCWGNGPTRAPAKSFSQVSVGQVSACGLVSSGTIQCWGKGSSTSPPSGKFTKVSVEGSGDAQTGPDSACGLRAASTIVCWGRPISLSGYGETYPVPKGTFIDVSTGYGFACGVRSGGAIRCWGAVDASLPVGSQ
jgi:alpha-tubulin suppressor-like RCC1 family protein